jgi:hypothetical protein
MNRLIISVRFIVIFSSEVDVNDAHDANDVNVDDVHVQNF